MMKHQRTEGKKRHLGKRLPWLIWFILGFGVISLVSLTIWVILLVVTQGANQAGAIAQTITLYIGLFTGIPILVLTALQTYYTMRNPSSEPISSPVPATFPILHDAINSSPIQDMVPLWFVPYRPNPFFTGREELLEQLFQQLHTATATALTQPQALYGLGGIGKTQLALEYLYRHRGEYRAIFLINAASHATLLSDINTILIQKLHIPETFQYNHDHLFEEWCNWLQTHEHWLIVFDNVDDLEMVQEIKSLLPANQRGHIILTTRQSTVGVVAEMILVGEMTPEEGTRLLLRRAKQIKANVSFEQLPEQQRRLARQLVEELGGLPLAIEQAGAYMEEQSMGVKTYLETYYQHQLKLFQTYSVRSFPYPYTVLTTWSLSFRKVQQTNLAAADLLYVCAFLYPDAIPEEVFLRGAESLGPALAPLKDNTHAFHQAISTLTSYSLIRRNHIEETLSMHRLMQAILKEILKPHLRQMWKERIIHVLAALFPESEYQTWTQCARLGTHVLQIINHSRESVLDSATMANLCFKCAGYLQDRMRWSEAEALYQRALRIWEQNLGLEHIQVAASLNGLAELYREQGRYEEAEPLYQRALHIREQVLGSSHIQIAASLNGLATLYRWQGKYEEAEPLYQRALRIREQVQGLMHPLVAVSLDRLATLYSEQGKYEKAEPLYQRALGIWEQTSSPEHPDVAHPLHNLAMLYRDQGKYEEAEPLLQRALHIREQAQGPEHFMVAYHLEGLATLYREQGKYEKAEPLYQRALYIRERVLESVHPLVATSLNELATLYRKWRKYEKAEPLYQRALYIRERAQGPMHPQIANSLNGLAELYWAQGKYEQARPFYQRAITICEQGLGTHHPTTRMLQENYTALLGRMGAKQTDSPNGSDVSPS